MNTLSIITNLLFFDSTLIDWSSLSTCMMPNADPSNLLRVVTCFHIEFLLRFLHHPQLSRDQLPGSVSCSFRFPLQLSSICQEGGINPKLTQPIIVTLWDWFCFSTMQHCCQYLSVKKTCIISFEVLQLVEINNRHLHRTLVISIKKKARKTKNSFLYRNI